MLYKNKELPMNENNEQTSKMPPSKPFHLSKLTDYQEGSIVSRTLAQRNGGTLTLFAFDAGQSLSEHSAPFDAIVQIIEGQAELVIGGEKVIAQSGQTVLMPANIPHSVNARQQFKMLLIMIRQVQV
jgi:quercetin dioxygenase-like cupin family protein